MTDTYGLKWLALMFTTVPTFCVDPDETAIERLVRSHLALPNSSNCAISLLTTGSCSRIYKIDTCLGAFVMRVALPIELPNKILSEITTAEFLRKNVGVSP
jgi:hypothetical protein